MVLSSEWSQIEVIDLINDGSGLGFGIVGGRSTGVVIKSILPGGIADKDNRIQSGDHILQIGEVNLRGLTAEQVATVLRQAGSQVRMVVARPIEATSLEFQTFGSTATIVPTKLLTDPEELDRQLSQNGYTSFFNINQGDTISLNSKNLENSANDDISSKRKSDQIYGISLEEFQSSNLNNSLSLNEAQLSRNYDDCNDLSPETERFQVTLTKNDLGLGITVAGYVCEREDLCGIFVKELNEGSEAFTCGKIQLNDRIIEVDEQSLNHLSNYEAVEKLKETKETVVLTLERYLRGPKFEHLQEALGNQEQKTSSPVSPAATTLSWIPIENSEQIEPEPSTELQEEPKQDLSKQNSESKEIFIEENFESNPTDDLETAIRNKWEGIIGRKSDIVVANLTKLKGLGISLEGTVDVEDGIELRPHHYIRSILPEGPVGLNGKLSPGDELLEVNGQKLLGIKHVDVVKILRELPNTVRLVCARKNDINRVIKTSQDHEAFETRNILGGSLKNLLPQPEQTLLKALSDTSLNTSSTATISDESSLQKTKSRSLEVTNLAMWSDTVEYVEIEKTDKGLGFSILDYQDPLDSNSSVIVVRSLVPKGSADVSKKITPGDRLISVNDNVIKNVSLNEAVQALKGTLPGIVKLGISKPVTYSSTNHIVNST